MNVYIPNAGPAEAKMLDAVGAASADELFNDIPDGVALKSGLKLGPPLSERELLADVRVAADANAPADELVGFLGAGAYDRLIPSAVHHLTQRSEFLTAYTPYQPEISQGTLGVIFEFQTMIAGLTGMDVANASMYDGASACAEAMLMAVRQTGVRRILISESVHPDTRAVIDTYARFNGIEVAPIGVRNGVTDLDALRSSLAERAAGFIGQSPNFFGLIEDTESAAAVVHEAKGLMIAHCADPLSLVLLKSPGESGADIAVGEGQSFGIGMNYGGPWLGFMAARSKLTRKMPGRIAGQTVDVDGNRAFVLTLQAREQHIRREKATSNICSNQGLNAATAVIYLSLLGGEGLREAARQSLNKAHYLCERLERAGRKRVFDGAFFDEFAVRLNTDARTVNERLLAKGFLGGYPLADALPKDMLSGIDGADRAVLLCATEKRSKDEIDKFVAAVEEADA